MNMQRPVLKAPEWNMRWACPTPPPPSGRLAWQISPLFKCFWRILGRIVMNHIEPHLPSTSENPNLSLSSVYPAASQSHGPNLQSTQHSNTAPPAERKRQHWHVNVKLKTDRGTQFGHLKVLLFLARNAAGNWGFHSCQSRVTMKRLCACSPRRRKTTSAPHPRRSRPRTSAFC